MAYTLLLAYTDSYTILLNILAMLLGDEIAGY